MARLVDPPEPSLKAPDEVKLKVLQVGICGTDREEVAGRRSLAPEGEQDLVIGHEMFGHVVEVGRSVSRVNVGDCAVFTVRRGCGKCLPCTMDRPDMCRTGEYQERGIWELDGYQTEFVIDKEQYLVRVQTARLPDAPSTPDWLFGRRCLVAGMGPIGLLAALALRLRGAEVYGLDIVDANTARPQWLAAIGGHYIDGREIPVDKVDDTLGPMELIVEGTGVAALEFNLLDALAPDGAYVLTGIPGGDLADRVGVDGYYVRVAPVDEAEAASPIQGFVPIKNRPPGRSTEPAEQIVSPDALALVRFGLRAPDDPRILNTVKVIDALLKVDTLSGPAWHRYNDDGYGEHEDGSPFDGTGIGRAWPLLTGERAHYELAAGRKDQAQKLLTAIETFANDGGMISEQIWDASDIPERELFFGRPSGSRFAPWRFNHKCREIPAGKTVRLETLAPARVRWGVNGWQDVEDRELPPALLPHQPERPLLQTRHCPQASQAQDGIGPKVHTLSRLRSYQRPVPPQEPCKVDLSCPSIQKIS